MPEEYYYQALTNVKDYQLTFPDYVQAVSLTQNDFGNFADITASGKGIGMNIQMGYSSDPVAQTFSADVTKGDYAGSTLTTSLDKTWSYDGKNPTGATKIHAVLKIKSSGLFSALSFVGDESIKFGLQQALDKIGDRAKVLQISRNTQIVSANPTQTLTNPSVTITTQTNSPTTKPQTQTPPQTNPTLEEQLKLAHAKVTEATANPPQTTPTPSPKLPTIVLYSSSVNGMSATIYGNAQSGTGKTLSNISWYWGDGQTSIGQFPQTHTYSQAGTYSVTATVTDNGLSSSATTSVVISSPQPQSNPTSSSQNSQQTTPSGNTIKVDGTDISLPYSITNGIVTGMKADIQSLSLIVSMQTTGDGQLTIDLPRAFIDARNGNQDDKFFVMINGQESQFTEVKTTYDRTLTIPFTDRTNQIEIVGTVILPTSNTSPSQSSTTIASTIYVVNPSTYTPIPFSLSCSASVTGTFSAHAGLGDNIDLFVFDQNNFQKYQNNNAYTYLYYNQRTGSGTFILNLNSGTYYIVLSNTYSVVSQKNVNLQASYTCN